MFWPKPVFFPCTPLACETLFSQYVAEEYMIVYGQANQSTGEAWLAATGLAYVPACLRAYPLGQTDVTDSVRCTNSYSYYRCMARICLTDFSEHFICLRFQRSLLRVFLFILISKFYRILILPFVHVFYLMTIPFNNFSEYFNLFLAHVPQYFAHTLSSESSLILLYLALLCVLLFVAVLCHRLLRIIFPRVEWLVSLCQSSWLCLGFLAPPTGTTCPLLKRI